MVGRPAVRRSRSPDGARADAVASVDIIALLVVGVFLVALFVAWERYLENVHTDPAQDSQRWWTPPPLMPVSIWARGNGKFAAVLAVAFVEWCAFLTFQFWVQVGSSWYQSVGVYAS